MPENPRARWNGIYTPIDQPHPRYPSETWGVEAWNDDGRRTTARGPWGDTLAGAIRRAGEMLESGGIDGQMYQHVEVVHFRYATCCKTETMTIEEAKQNV